MRRDGTYAAGLMRGHLSSGRQEGKQGRRAYSSPKPDLQQSGSPSEELQQQASPVTFDAELHC